MTAYQIQVRGLLDGVTPFVLPSPVPEPSDGGVIKIDAGVGVDVGRFNLAELSDPNIPVWVRAYHAEFASGTLASRSDLLLQGSRQNQLLVPINSVSAGALLQRPAVLNPNGVTPVGAILRVLTDDTDSTFGGSPVAGPHFVYLDLVPLTDDETATLAQDMEAFADAKARAQGEVYESFQSVAATLGEDLGLWVSPIALDIRNNAATGQIQAARVSVGTAPAAAESMVVAIQHTLGAITTIMATVTIDSTFSDGDVVDIPLTTNTINIFTDSRIRVLRTYTAGGGPTPMANTTVRVQVVPVRDPNGPT